MVLENIPPTSLFISSKKIRFRSTVGWQTLPEIDVAAEFFIMPSIEVTLAHIGGPSCGLKGSFNFLAHGSLKLPETFVNKLRAQFGERRLLGSANPIAESNTVADRRLLSSKKKTTPKKRQQRKRKQQS